MPETKRVLGLVNGTNVDKKTNPIAWITPLVDASGGWQSLQPDDWPAGTNVFWPLAKGALKDALVYFQPKENPPDQKDRYIAADVQPALEVLDCSALKLEASLRARFTSESGGEQRTGLVLILGPNDDVFGPVRLTAQPGKSSVVEPSARHKIPVHRKSDVPLRHVRHLSRVRLVAEHPPSQPYRYTDWGDDATVIKRALDFVLEQSRREGGAKALGLTNRLIAEIAQTGAALGDSPEQALHRERLDRCRDLLTNSLSSCNALEAVVESLRQLPEVKAALENELAKERKLVREQVHQEVDQKKGSLKSLNAELATLQAALAEKKADIEAAEREYRSSIAKMQEALDARVSEVLRQPQALLADVAVLKSLLAPQGVLAPTMPDTRLAASVAGVPTWALGESVIENPEDFRKALLRRLKALGVAGEPVVPLVAATLARHVPIVYGTGAQRALRAYADVVAAGRLRVVSISPTLTRMQDLFGGVDPSTKTFVPHPDGLLDLVSAARRSGGFSVVCLESVNLAATEAVLLPLLNAIADAREINLAHSRALRAGDEYLNCLSFTWPTNLILVATLIEGPTSLPISAEIWRHSALIEANGVGSPNPAAVPQSSDLAADIIGSNQPALTVAQAAFLEFGEYSGFIPNAAEFAQFISGSEEQRELAVAKALLLPLCAGADQSDETVDRLARTFSVDKQIAKNLLQRTRRVVA